MFLQVNLLNEQQQNNTFDLRIDFFITNLLLVFLRKKIYTMTYVYLWFYGDTLYFMGL